VERDPLTEKVIGCAIEVHKNLGPGLLENIYESALCAELETTGLLFRRQSIFPVIYKGKPIGEHRIDLIIANALIVELKSVERFDPIFEAQVLTYFKNHRIQTRIAVKFQFPIAQGRNKTFRFVALCVLCASVAKN
jgi:GxxExxY protein